MSVLEAIIYGIIQGIAEFLPISSSGHLSLAQNFAPKLFGTEIGNAAEANLGFNVALHLATLVSVCVVYRKDVWMLFMGFISLIKKLFTGKLTKRLEKGEKLFLMLVIATLPLIPAKLLGYDDAVEIICGTSWAIGGLLMLNGLMLFVIDRLKTENETTETSGLFRPLGVGVMQAVFGVLPGISRSGSTITGGIVFGFSKEESVRFSFLMSIPAILGACVLELPDMISEGVASDMLVPLIVGAVTACAVGFLAIKLLQYLTKNKSFTFFAVYCIIIGLAAIIADIVIA